MSSVLDDEKQQQILALGRLGWTLRRIEAAVAVRRETVSGYLKAAGIAVGGRGRRSESKPKPAIFERGVHRGYRPMLSASVSSASDGGASIETRSLDQSCPYFARFDGQSSGDDRLSTG
jgi:hypothetical protein